MISFSKESRELRDRNFKIWRSKQSYFMNSIIGIALFLKDILILILMCALAIGAIAIIALFLIQVTGNAYSGH